MGYVTLYHPEHELRVDVPEESVWHHRLGGWVLQSEYEESHPSADVENVDAPPPDAPDAQPAGQADTVSETQAPVSAKATRPGTAKNPPTGGQQDQAAQAAAKASGEGQ